MNAGYKRLLDAVFNVFFVRLDDVIQRFDRILCTFRDVKHNGDVIARLEFGLMQNICG